MKKYPSASAHERARILRRDMTDAERRVWRMLRTRQIAGQRFRRQVPIGRYIADFVCHEARLVVEVDGGQHDAASADDAERTRFLDSQGYRVLRFWNNEVTANLDGVLARIAGVLAERSPPPGPSPIEGEGKESGAFAQGLGPPPSTGG